jgi:ATP-binding protein involved in chromosome partitioning
MAISLEAAQSALASVLAPDLGQPLSDLGMIRDLHVQDGAATLTVVIPMSDYPQKEAVGRAVREALLGAGAASVHLNWDINPLPLVENIVLVMSGKGGVGKSTVATNLTMALQRAGHRVGLLDADIYGPSIPTMMGVAGRPISQDGKKIEPLQRFGVKLMSIGFLLEDPRSAVIWRGPMLHGALLQFLKDVNWGPLDFLLLDLPPGTGDVALTLSQRAKVTGAVVVTTPQEVALQDVYKSVAMCKKVEIPILGVVENMSYFEDPSGQQHRLFGEGGGAKIAEFAEAPLLGQLPLDPRTREWGDAGTPVVQAAPQLPVSQAFAAMAERLVERVASHRGASPEAGLLIDRSGGQGRVKLPVMR